MISLISNLDDGMQAEVGIIGQEGMLGASLLSGVDTFLSRPWCRCQALPCA
jgi:hypothetical protein